MESFNDEFSAGGLTLEDAAQQVSSNATTSARALAVVYNNPDVTGNLLLVDAGRETEAWAPAQTICQGAVRHDLGMVEVARPVARHTSAGLAARTLPRRKSLRQRPPSDADGVTGG